MRTIALLFALVGWTLTPATAGTIKGTVRAEGKREAQQDIAGGKYESRRYKFLERVNYDELREFVVYIDQPLAEKPVPPEKPVEVVVQKDAMFTPHVLPVVVGTKVAWPNHDEIFHNVFSVSEPGPFDLGLYKDEVHVVPFTKPGRVDAFCSIHARMHCIILVLENSHFAVTDAKRHYAITNVPPGTYKLKAWHERVPAQVKEITVPANGDVTVDFTLGITGLPKY
jgi:plastocyanin